MSDNAKDRAELLDAQVAVLGCMLIEERTIGPILGQLQDSDFPEPTYRMIYSAIRQQFASGQATDVVTIADRLGGLKNDLLAQLMQVTPTAANYEAYVKILKRKAQLFNLRDLAVRMSGAEDAEEYRALLDQALLLSVDRPEIRAMTMEQALSNFYDRHAEQAAPEYLNWGLEGLDDHVKAEGGDMVIIGARPSVGKTVIAAQFAWEQASRGKNVGFFSLETSAPKLFDRLIASRTRIDLSRIQSNDLHDSEWDLLAHMSGKLIAPKLELIEAAGWTVTDIRTYAMAKRFDVIYIDYLQLVRVADAAADVKEFDRVTLVSRALQLFGRESHVGIVALSQLSREERNNTGKAKMPTMRDLRSSGQLEQDAQIVMVMARESSNDNNSRRILKVIKNKDGEADLLMYLNLDGPHMRFTKSFVQTAKPDKKDPTPEKDQPAPNEIPQDVMGRWTENRKE